MTTQAPPPFIKPDGELLDRFRTCQGRPNFYACKLCVPEGKSRGVAMQLAVALRHERTCEKHLEKVKEAVINDWEYQPGCDWGPSELPIGTTAWEVSYPADRADDLINYWRENVEAAMRDEPTETMDSFINRFNQKYADWLREWRQETDEWKEGQENANAQEEPAAECEGVKGWWYSGGSFDPHDDGILPPRVSPSPESLAAEAKQQVWGPPPEDPYEVWGISRDEVTPWTDVPAPVQQGSDATPIAPSTRTSRRPHKNVPRRNSRGKGMGKQAFDAGNGRPDGRKAKIH
ncbi:hypothetical protein C8T65DRAFT_631055 [Cerioporus squamosus]|nr:hypothetical protein C8T65DRAFT_631055 [Cerioporus squamosus]